MKLQKLTALCLAASAFTATSAMAWESEDGQHSTSASVALSTDYMWRGTSQTDNEAAVSGSFDYSHSTGFYAGAWASNIQLDDSSIEIDGYLGYASEFGDTGISYDVGFMRYFFPGNDRNGDWNEIYAALSYSYFSFKVSHSADALASHESATHYLFGFNYGLPMGVEFHANYAFYDFDDLDGTFGAAAAGVDDTLEDFNLGFSKEIAGFGFDLTYYNTLSDAEELVENLNGGSDSIADDRFVFTISKSL